jgi:hypothetical protein
MKIKILKPVTIGGAIHRPNKLGNIAEVSDEHGKILIDRSFAEKAAAAAKVTLGVTVRPDMPPPVVELKSSEEAAADLSEEKKHEEEEKLPTREELVAEYSALTKPKLGQVIAEMKKVPTDDPKYATAQVAIEVCQDLLKK